ncbi:Ig domain-containing protein [Vibrio parahaemolyticus]|nr:hypothetical protein [Vibrio parahaemolyticus]
MLKALKFCSIPFLLLTFLISGCNDKGKDTTEGVVHESYNDIKLVSVPPQKKVDVARLLQNHGVINPSNIELIYGDNLQCDFIKDTNGGAEIYLTKDSWCILSYKNNTDIQGKRILSLVSDSQSDLKSYAKVTSLTHRSKDDKVLIKPKKLLGVFNAIQKGYSAKDASFLVSNDKEIKEIDYDHIEEGYLVPHESSSSFKMIYAYSNLEGNVIQGLVMGSFSSVENSTPIASRRKITVAVGVDEVIDMKDFVSDSDGDKLQIIDIIDNSGSVKPYDKNDVYNLKLNANFTQAGSFDVVYVVSDHKGAVASNVISFIAKGSSEGLDNIFDDTGKGVYSFPENVDIATNSGHTGFLTTSIEDGVTGVEGVEYPLYDVKKGSAVCALKGKKLPNRSEMEALWNKEGNLYSTNHWPVGQKYVGVDSLGGFQFDMSIGKLEEVTNASGYVTCYGYSYDKIDIIERWLVLDKSRQLHIIASYEGSTIPSIPPVINWEVDDESMATIDSSGLLTSLGKEGVVTVTATTIDGVLGSKDIKIVRNLFETYGSQDPSFDSNIDAAGLNYSQSCLADDDEFVEFAGIPCTSQDIPQSGADVDHTCASLCTVSSNTAPNSGRGFAKTFGWKLGALNNGQGSWASPVPRFERFEENPNYVLSYSMNLNDWLLNESYQNVKGVRIFVMVDAIVDSGVPGTARFLFYLTRSHYSESGIQGVTFDTSREPEIIVGKDSAELKDWNYYFDSNTGWFDYDFSFLLKGDMFRPGPGNRTYKVSFVMEPNFKASDGGGCFDANSCSPLGAGDYQYGIDELVLFPGDM